jgi:hypothetical protein
MKPPFTASFLRGRAHTKEAVSTFLPVKTASTQVNVDGALIS